MTSIVAWNIVFFSAIVTFAFTKPESFKNRTFYESIFLAVSSDDLGKLSALLNGTNDSELIGNPVVSQLVFHAIDRKSVKCLERLLELCPDGTVTKAFINSHNSSCQQQAGINMCHFWEAASMVREDAIIESSMKKGCERCLAKTQKSINPSLAYDQLDLSGCQNQSAIWIVNELDGKGHISNESDKCKTYTHEDLLTNYGEIISQTGKELKNKDLHDMKNTIEDWKSKIDGYLSLLCTRNTSDEEIFEDIFEEVSIEYLLSTLKEKEPLDTPKSFAHCIAQERRKDRTENDICEFCSSYRDKKYERLNVFHERWVNKCWSCPEKTEDINGHAIVVKATNPGDTFHSPCPIHHESTFASWKCKHNGDWDRSPDLSLCRGNILVEPHGNGTAFENLMNLKVHLVPAEIYPGDVESLPEELTELRSRFREDSDNGYYNASEQRAFLKLELQVVSDLNSKPTIFASNDTFRRKTFSIIQDFVTTGAQWIRDSLEANTSHSVITEDVGVFMENRPASHYKKKENRLFRNLFSSTSTMVLPEDFFVDYETSDNDSQHVLLQVQSYKDIQNAYDGSKGIGGSASAFTGDMDLVNSHLFGAKIGSGNWKGNPDKPVILTFAHIYNDSKFHLSNVRCVWWNLSEDNWSTQGCVLKDTSHLYTVCHCDHLTDFSVIMNIKDPGQEGGYPVLGLLSQIGGIASIICLALTLIGYWILIREKKKSHRNKSIKIDLTTIHLYLSLFLFHCFFLPDVSGETTSTVLCNAMTFFRHYFLMATFTWNAVWAVMLYVRAVMESSKIFPTLKMLVIAGYGLPLCVVLLVFATSFFLDKYANEKVCWIAPGFAALSFVCTLSLIMLVNLTVFANYIRKFYCKREETFSVRIQSSNRNTQMKLRGSFALFFNLGLTWVLGWLLLFQDDPAFGLLLLFVVFNSTQGIPIFIFFVINGDNMKNIRSFMRNCMKTNELLPIRKVWYQRTADTTTLSDTTEELTIADSA